MNQEQKLTSSQEQVAPPEGNPGFLERFWLVFALLAVIFVLGVGTLWYFNQRLITPKTTPRPIPSPTPSPIVETDTMTSALEQQDTSDEITAIETDIEATELSEIDKELADIEEELSSP